MGPLIWCLVCVVLIMGLAYLFTRYVVGRGLPMGLGRAQQGMMEVLTQLSLGRDKQILLVRVGERYLLLGSTASAVTTLAELSPDEVDTWRETAREAAENQPRSFAESLREVLKQRGGRYNGD